MKAISALTFITLAFSGYYVAAAAYDSAPTTRTSSSLLRGSAAALEEATGTRTEGAMEQQQQQQRRTLQRSDETCWAVGDETGNNDQIPCTQDVLNSCNNVPACAAYEQDAISLGGTWCSIWTVWNNEEPTCAWQYMCC